MVLFIDDPEIEQLAKELAVLMDTSVEVAVRTALTEAIERFKTESTIKIGEAESHYLPGRIDRLSKSTLTKHQLPMTAASVRKP